MSYIVRLRLAERESTICLIMVDYARHIRAMGERTVRWLTEAPGRTREQALGNLESHLKGQVEYSSRLMSAESLKKAAEILLISCEHRAKAEKV